VSKRALGRGIDALLMGGGDPPDGTDTITTVAVEKIVPGEGQPRKTFRDDTLAELADSIRERGLLQPILVEQNGDIYSIIAGERRYRASVKAGLTHIPVIVKAFSKDEKLQIALIENIQREDLSPIEEAEAYRALMSALKIGQEDLSRRLGKNRSTIANSLRLLNLPGDMQRALAEGELTAGHARALLSVQDSARRAALFKRILDEGLSVREAEAAGEQSRSPKTTSPAKRGTEKRRPEIGALEQGLVHRFGTKVTVSGGLDRGAITIHYFSRDDLDRIHELLFPEQPPPELR
jgi:ParB family transcriptional regulator, chromosome partitioning protein